MALLLGRIRAALASRQLPYRFPRLYNLLVYRGVFAWLGMSGAAQTALERARRAA